MSGPSEPRLVDAAPLRYLLALPEGGGDGPRPVLCFLHGYDEAAPRDIHEALTLHGPLRPGNPPVVRDFIVVAPQLTRAGDHWLRHADDVRRIVDEVRAEHGGDPRRTYLTGFSFGGNGVFDLGLAQPDAWAALWPVDPTRVPRQDPGVPVWLSFGSIARAAEGAVRRGAAAAPGGRRGPARLAHLGRRGAGPRGLRAPGLPRRAHLHLAAVEAPPRSVGGVTAVQAIGTRMRRPGI